MKNLIAALLVGFLLLAPVLAFALEVGDEAPLFEAVSDKGPVTLLITGARKMWCSPFILLPFHLSEKGSYRPSRKTSNALKT